jgi:hypothetical protein
MPIPVQRWRSPAVLRVKALVFAALGVTVAAVFFPVWFAVPVAVVFGGWELSLAVLGAAVTVDKETGLLVFRMGLLRRRVRITDVTSVLVDASKVSIARAGGGEVSFYAWRKSPLDNWLRVPAITEDIGHAVASAVALAQDKVAPDKLAQGNALTLKKEGAAKRAVRTGTSARARSTLASTLLGCTGLVALASAFLVRLHWHNPVMTTLGVILAVALGVSGLFYVLFTLWLFTRRAPRPAGDRPSTA